MIFIMGFFLCIFLWFYDSLVKNFYGLIMIGNKGIILQSWLNAWNSVKNTLYASYTAAGIVSTTAQVFSGFKKFQSETPTSASIIECHNSTGTSYNLCVKNYGSAGVNTSNPLGAWHIGGGGNLVLDNLGKVQSLNSAVSAYLDIFYMDSGNNININRNLGVNQGNTQYFNNVIFYNKAVDTTCFHLETTTKKIGINTVAGSATITINGALGDVWISNTRHTTANTAGNNFILTAPGATAGATDKNGGTVKLSGGISTGTGESGVQLASYKAGASGTSDNSQYIVFETAGDKWSFSQNSTITPTITQTGWSTTGLTPNRTLSSSATITDTINVLGTLIEDLKTKGIILS